MDLVHPNVDSYLAELSRSTETVWQQYTAILGKKNMRTTIENLNRLLEAEL